MTTSTENRYIECIGRRKTSVARVRVTFGHKGSHTVNSRPLAEYFPTKELQRIAESALVNADFSEKVSISAHIKGGGIHSQAESFRHGTARALVEHDLELRKSLKKEGFLKRDARSKERRKFGLKKARKAPQWSKR